ncbi:glycoside hydrolase family 5 protein, partial [bacterium]
MNLCGLPFQLPVVLSLAVGLISTSATAQTPSNLISNGDFEADKDADKWPDDWGKLDHGASYETENGNHFFQLSYTKSNDTLIAYRLISIPVGTEALELSFRARTNDLQAGKEPWFDARIMMNFKDGGGQVVNPGPAAPYFRDSTKEWTQRSTKFLVPPGATSLEFMPALFQVKSGNFDLDDVVLKPIEAEVLKNEAAAQEKIQQFLNLAPEVAQPAKWPRELKVRDNKIVNPKGEVVRLQGVNIESLEWTAAGESVLRATQVAIDDWKSNVIRLPVSSEFWFGKDSADGGKAYRQLVEDTITLAANHGAYTLLDLHHFGAPRQRDVDFWKEAATRYKDNSTVIFDLFNEPHGTTWQV